MKRRLLSLALVLLSDSCFADSDTVGPLILAEDADTSVSLLKNDTSITLDSIETVGDFSSIEFGEDLLLQEEVFGEKGDLQSRKKEEDLSRDLSEVFNLEDSLLAISDPLQVDDSFFEQLEDPLKSSGNLLDSLENFKEEF